MFFPRKVKFTIDFSDFYVIILFARADVMELADVTDSKSVALTGMRVRPPPSAPKAPFGVLFQLYPICAVRQLYLSGEALSSIAGTYVLHFLRHGSKIEKTLPPLHFKDNGGIIFVLIHLYKI